MLHRPTLLWDRLRRLRLFVRDYCQEFGVAWSVARHNDCERAGGHRWGKPQWDALFGWSIRCGRCKCSQTITETEATASPYTTTIRMG